MRNNTLLRLFGFLLCLAWPLVTRAEVVVIVHPDNPLRNLTPGQVSDLYLGRNRTFSIGDQKELLLASIYEHPTNSRLRENFFRTLNGMPISRLNAYWARLRFSGEVLPPVALADSHEMLEVVSHNRSAIGYVEAAEVRGSSVKIVLRLKE